MRQNLVVKCILLTVENYAKRVNLITSIQDMR